MRRYRPLNIVLGCLSLLLLFAGSGAPLSPVSAWPQATVAPDAGPAFVPPPQDGCAPRAGGWTIDRPDMTKDLAAQSSRTLALDAASRPHIAYGGDMLYHAWYDGAAWHREVVDSTRGVGIYASLALDALDRPHISYYDDLQDDMKYAYFDGAQWHIQTIDPVLSDS